MPELIKCRAMIEVLGKPKEHVEQALKGYIERIRGDKNYQVFKSEVYDSEEKEDGFWVTFGELEFSAKDIPSVIGFFGFMSFTRGFTELTLGNPSYKWKHKGF